MIYLDLRSFIQNMSQPDCQACLQRHDHGCDIAQRSNEEQPESCPEVVDTFVSCSQLET